MNQNFPFAIPFVGAIIERTVRGTTEILIQTRWKPETDAIYSGTFEFPAGVLDKPFENVYETLKREIKEETGLMLKQIKNNSQTQIYSPQKDDASFAFRPFCCVQQLAKGYPLVGFIFLCEVENGELVAQKSEVKDIQWVSKEKVQRIFKETPEKMFTPEIAAWEYYFAQQ